MADISNLQNKLQTILNERATTLESVRGQLSKGHITVDGAQDSMRRAIDQRGWEITLKQVEALTRGHIDEPRQAADALLATITQPGGDPVAFELRARRIWERHVRILDAAGPVMAGLKGLEALREATDPAEVAVLIQELPGYLEAQGEDADEAADLITRTLAQSHPAYGAAVYAANIAEASGRTILQNAERLRTLLESGSTASVDDGPGEFLYDPENAYRALDPRDGAAFERQRLAAQQRMTDLLAGSQAKAQA